MKLLSRIWQNRRGNVIIIMGAMLPLVIGCAGLATDTIQWTLWKRQLQRAADSAAIAGVYTRTVTDTQTAVETAVCNDLVKNQHTGLVLAGSYTTCPDGTTRRGPVTLLSDSGNATKQVRVSLTVQQSLPFSSMFMTSVPQIVANATASSVPGGGTACFLGLTTSASETGLAFTGNAAVVAPNCDGFSDSSSTNSSSAKGSADVTLNTVGGVGGVQASNNFHVTAYRPYSPVLADPFIGIAPNPTDMVCKATITTTTGNGNGNGSGGSTSSTTTTAAVALDENTVLPLADASSGVSKATNCFSSLSVSSGKTLTLPAGTYYINGGDAFIQGNITCTACTIILTNVDPTSTTIGQFKVNASSNVNLTAPTSGTYAGIAIYQDRRAVDSNANVNKINGNSNSIINGAMYFPNQQLEYNGTGTTSAVCTMFVAKRLVFTGNSTTSNKFNGAADCPQYPSFNVQALRIIRLTA
ncbi:MAG: pilus assembly protein TadG-related protein [Sphingomicrobium sp.]